MKSKYCIHKSRHSFVYMHKRKMKGRQLLDDHFIFCLWLSNDKDSISSGLSLAQMSALQARSAKIKE